MSSELQEIIHRTMHLAFEQGKQAEQERIVKLLENQYCDGKDCNHLSVRDSIALIKEEQK